MTDMSIAELIAEAQTHVTDEYITPDTSAEESLIRRLAAALEAADKWAENAEQGLYDVYDALGFDKDGARTPRELFGPMVNGTPAEIVVEAAKEFREDSEREADEADQRAVQAEAELRDAFRTDIPSLKDQRDALAAVVEKVREVLEPDERKLGRTSQTALEEVRSALAPANDERSSHDPEARG